MAFRRTEGMSIMQALAMTVAEIPVFVYTTFGQVQGAGKVFLSHSLGWLCGVVCVRWSHNGVVLGDLGSLRDWRNCRGSSGWWKRVVLSGLEEERKALPTFLPGRTPRFNLSLHQRR